jgi:hypothetical protein
MNTPSFSDPLLVVLSFVGDDAPEAWAMLRVWPVPCRRWVRPRVLKAKQLWLSTKIHFGRRVKWTNYWSFHTFHFDYPIHSIIRRHVQQLAERMQTGPLTPTLVHEYNHFVRMRSEFMREHLYRKTV